MAASSASGDSPTCRILDAAFRGNLSLLKGLAAELGYGREERAKALMNVRDSKGRTVLHYAAGGGKIHVCRYLVEQLKLDVNVKDYKGYAPLHTAILDKQYTTSVYLLDHGAQPDAANERGLTPLHCAAEIGRHEELCLLISKGVEVDALSLRGTPLQCAAADGMEIAVKILLDNHANPNSVSQQMQTPLVLAILANSINCARLLLKAGADPNMVSHGTAPLFVAVCEGQTDITKCLLKAGADPNATNFVKMAAMRGRHADVMALLPVTTPIPGIPDWSVDGILDYVISAEAENQRQSRVENKFHEAKAKGAEAFRRKNYLEAIHWYTEAMTAKPKDATVYSNMSLCWACLNDGNNALKDAMICIMLRPDWPKAYYRAGVARIILQDYKEAVEAFERGLVRDPENKDLQDAKREAEAALGAAQMGDSRGTSTAADGFDYQEFYSTMFWLSRV